MGRLKAKLKSDSNSLKDDLEHKIFISVKEVMEANQEFQKDMTRSMFEFQAKLEGNTEACTDLQGFSAKLEAIVALGNGHSSILAGLEAKIAKSLEQDFKVSFLDTFAPVSLDDRFNKEIERLNEELQSRV
jgi:hypothetical protein